MLERAIVYNMKGERQKLNFRNSNKKSLIAMALIIFMIVPMMAIGTAKADTTTTLTITSDTKIGTTTYTSIGGPTPPEGTDTVTIGSSVTASVSSPATVNGVLYLCTGFSGLGTSPDVGNGPESSVTFTVTGADTVAWSWAPATTLTVTSLYGNPNPAVGTDYVPIGGQVKASVSTPVMSGGLVYACTGWTGTGPDVPSTGTANSFTYSPTSASLTTLDTLTWNWVQIPNPKGDVSVVPYQNDGPMNLGNQINTWSITTNMGGTPNLLSGTKRLSATQIAVDVELDNSLSTMKNSLGEPISGVWGYSFNLNWTPTVLQLVNVVDGGYLTSADSPQSDNFLYASTLSDNVHGTQTGGVAAALGANPAPLTLPTSDGVLVTLVFNVISNGVANVQVSNVQLFSGGSLQGVAPTSINNAQIDLTGLSGSTTVQTGGTTKKPVYTTYTVPSLESLTVTSAYGNPIPIPAGASNFFAGSTITETVTSPVIAAGLTYTTNGYTGTSPDVTPGTGTSATFTVNNPDTITWNWQQTTTTLTVTSTANSITGVGSPTPPIGPNTETVGASVTSSVTSPVVLSGVPYVCTGYTGTGDVGSGTGTSVTYTATTAASTITWNWQISTASLTVSSPYGNPTPSGISQVSIGTSVTASVTSPWITASAAYVCTGYTGTGDVGSGTGNSVTFTLTKPDTITWNWLQLPNPTNPKAAISFYSSPVGPNTVWGNAGFSLSGATSSAGTDTVPTTLSCPITSYSWTITLVGGGIVTSSSKIVSLTAAQVGNTAGTITASLAINAPDTETVSDPLYTPTSTATVTIQVLPNNVAGSISAVPSGTQTATSMNIPDGQTFSIDLYISGASGVWGWSTDVTWNPAVLQLQSVTEGSYLSQTGATYFVGDNSKGQFNTALIDNKVGTIDGGLSDAYQSATTTASSSSGVLVTLTFQAVANGNGNLALTNAQLIGGSGATPVTIPPPPIVVSSILVTPEYLFGALISLGAAFAAFVVFAVAKHKINIPTYSKHI
jgi:hypothetical protein